MYYRYKAMALRLRLSRYLTANAGSLFLIYTGLKLTKKNLPDTVASRVSRVQKKQRCKGLQPFGNGSMMISPSRSDTPGQLDIETIVVVERIKD